MRRQGGDATSVLSVLTASVCASVQLKGVVFFVSS